MIFWRVMEEVRVAVIESTPILGPGMRHHSEGSRGVWRIAKGSWMIIVGPSARIRRT